MTQFIIPLFIGMAISTVGVLAIYFTLRWFRSDAISKRLTTYVTDPTVDETRRGTTFRMAPRQLSGSFVNRVFSPAIRGIGRFLGQFTPASAIESIGRRLILAGNPYGLGPREFFGINLAFTILGAFLAFFVLRRGPNALNIVSSLLVILLLFMLPRMWLQVRALIRQNAVRKGLPDALDMLSVCATAGLGFDQSLQRVSEYWDTPIGNEFGRVIAEMEMGFARREALRNLADRLDIREISSFVALILQTEQLGMSISDTLHAQAEQMRIERRFRAQEQAQKAPTKMLIPMAFLIFPALLAVILGPAIPTLMEVFNQF